MRPSVTEKSDFAYYLNYVYDLYAKRRTDKHKENYLTLGRTRNCYYLYVFALDTFFP